MSIKLSNEVRELRERLEKLEGIINAAGLGPGRMIAGKPAPDGPKPPTPAQKKEKRKEDVI